MSNCKSVISEHNMRSYAVQEHGSKEHQERMAIQSVTIGIPTIIHSVTKAR